MPVAPATREERLAILSEKIRDVEHDLQAARAAFTKALLWEKDAELEATDAQVGRPITVAEQLIVKVKAATVKLGEEPTDEELEEARGVPLDERETESGEDSIPMP